MPPATRPPRRVRLQARAHVDGRMGRHGLGRISGLPEQIGMRHREATRRGLLPRPPAEGSGPRAGVRVSRSGSSRSIRASATPRTLTVMSQRNSSISRAISGRAASTARWSRLSRIEGSASSSAEASRMFARMAAIVWRSDTVPSCRARSARGGSPSRQAPCEISRSGCRRPTRTRSRRRQSESGASAEDAWLCARISRWWRLSNCAGPEVETTGRIE